MKILAAFDKCKDSLTSGELSALAKKTLERDELIEVEPLPITDGGEGFVEIFTEGGSGDLVKVKARDSLGRKHETYIGICELVELPAGARKLLKLPVDGKVGVIEMASISGLAQLSFEERNAWKTSSIGVGDLIKKSGELGVNAILLGIGGSSTNDAGIGALSALGLEIFDREGLSNSFPCPESWPKIGEFKKSNLCDLPPISIACDVSNPLLGPNGATHQFGRQKGLNYESRVEMEKQVQELVARLEQSFPRAKAKALAKGCGAAGGMGYGLSLAFDVNLVSGFELISAWFELEEKIKKADLIITGEGRFDQTSLLGKAPFELIRLANKANVKSLVLAGSVEMEAKEQCKKQFPLTEVYQFGDPSIDLEENLARAPELFIKKLEEIFR